jgi:hypothetical protein
LENGSAAAPHRNRGDDRDDDVTPRGARRRRGR